MTTIYIVKPEFLSVLCSEIQVDHSNISKEWQAFDERLIDAGGLRIPGDLSQSIVIQDLVFSPFKNTNVCFASDIWFEAHIINFEFISEAVNILRKAGKFWYMHPISNIGRSKLIAEQLRKLPSLTRNFPIEKEIPAIGGFCLLNKNTLVYSTKRLKKWPHGQCFFIEDKINPPNRAYLKLWETLTLLEKHPGPNDKVLDLGASPGGWTYVLQSLGATVTAVDKAPLDARIQALPRINFLQQSAFALDPNTIKDTYDWVFSDIACYPDRAYALIMKWIDSGKTKHIVVTIKLQGEISPASLQQFKNIPNSKTIHLFHNKHEVTFIWKINYQHALIN